MSVIDNGQRSWCGLLCDASVAGLGPNRRRCLRKETSRRCRPNGGTMPDHSVRTGGCLCGAIRYEVRGEPYVAGLCHCSTCRKLTGSSFSATANWTRDRFSMTGEPATYENRQFCPICGSRLFWISDEGVEIFLGTLDLAPYDIKPTLEIWTIRRESWLPPLPGVILHGRNPP
jgi:hypothetical protein